VIPITKDFHEVLKDGFQRITDITDPELLSELRDDGVQVDSEGYYSFCFGERKEYEICVEPLPQENQYFVAVYKNRILINHKLPVWATEKK
jgi:hypothetical protein